MKESQVKFKICHKIKTRKLVIKSCKNFHQRKCSNQRFLFVTWRQYFNKCQDRFQQQIKRLIDHEEIGLQPSLLISMQLIAVKVLNVISDRKKRSKICEIWWGNFLRNMWKPCENQKVIYFLCIDFQKKFIVNPVFFSSPSCAMCVSPTEI